MLKKDLLPTPVAGRPAGRSPKQLMELKPSSADPGPGGGSPNPRRSAATRSAPAPRPRAGTSMWGPGSRSVSSRPAVAGALSVAIGHPRERRYAVLVPGRAPADAGEGV